MNTRKSSRKDQSTDDDLSCASTSSSSTLTSKASFEDYDFYSGDEDSASDDASDADRLQIKLDILQEDYCEKKIENTVLKRCIEVKNVSKFLNDLFSKKKSKDSVTEEQKRTIIELYEKNRELSKQLKKVKKENKNTTKEIFHLYSDLEDVMEERKVVWSEAVKVLKLNLGNSSAFLNLLNLEESDTFNESNFKQKEKEYLLRSIDYAVFTKSFQVMRIARILYSLIANSGVPWNKDNALWEILECTSKIFDKNFDLKNRKEFMETVDEVTQRLNKVKMHERVPPTGGIPPFLKQI